MLWVGKSVPKTATKKKKSTFFCCCWSPARRVSHSLLLFIIPLEAAHNNQKKGLEAWRRENSFNCWNWIRAECSDVRRPERGWFESEIGYVAVVGERRATWEKKLFGDGEWGGVESEVKFWCCQMLEHTRKMWVFKSFSVGNSNHSPSVRRLPTPHFSVCFNFQLLRIRNWKTNNFFSDGENSLKKLSSPPPLCARRNFCLSLPRVGRGISMKTQNITVVSSASTELV